MTIIEILIVIAVIGMIITFGSFINVNVFSSDTFRTEEYTIVSILEKARSRSMANMYDTSHGVCYIAPNYVIFREADGHCVNGVSSNELIPANANIASYSSFSSSAKFPIINFTRLSGDVGTAPIDILLTDGTKSAHILINNEGTITW